MFGGMPDTVGQWLHCSTIVTGRVQLVWTAPTYGGRRWWFLCPRTGCRATKHFCRMVAGISGAAKSTVSDMPANAKIGLAGFNEGLPCSVASLAARVGEPGTCPKKPKWMRWRTYERKYERWEHAVEKANEEFTVRATRLLKWK
jgi:hypothetical protein